MTQTHDREVMPVMQMTGITKHFGDVIANDRVSFDLKAGEIHALVGENGAGKTTLMSILFGLLAADAGEISIDGSPVQFNSPADAIAAGIGMVHQHFKLVPSFTIAENVTLGSEPRKHRFFDQAAAAAAAAAPLATLGLSLDPAAVVGSLSVASQQKVEIAKVLYRGARIIILDEPTAVLTPQETEELWVLLRRLAADGASIVFISHKLREVFAIADRITVLRAGRTVVTLAADSTDASEVVAAMTGRSNVNLGRVERDSERGGTVLRIEGLSTAKYAHDAALADVSFEVRSGEVVGIAGVEGNGQSVLAEAIVGLVPATAGAITLLGQDVTTAVVAQRRNLGLGYVPEDRQVEGLPINASVVEGLAAGQIRLSTGWRGLRPAITRGIRGWARQTLAKYDVRTSSELVTLRQLSGGNQQKVVLARELDADPALLVLSQPTRGVDLGAIDFIYSQIGAATRRGCAVLLVSADLDEIFRVADRVLVMYRGGIATEQVTSSATREGLGLYMTGLHEAEAAR